MANSTVTGSRNKPVQLARCGCFYDPRYGDFQITHAQLDRMIENFQRRVTGTDIFIDVSHRPENGAAGKITRIWRDGDVLMANVEWTPYGLTSMEEKGYCYLSMDYDEDYKDNETKIAYGCVLKGAGLTIRPFIKRLEKVQLDEFAQFKTALAKTGIPPQSQTALAGNYLTLAELLPSDALQGIGERIIRCAELLDFPTLPVAGIPATFAQFKTALAKTGISPQSQTALAGNYLALAELLPSDALQGIGERIIRCAELLDFPTPPVAGIPATPAPPATLLSERQVKEIIDRWFQKQEQEQKQQQRAREQARTAAMERFLADTRCWPYHLSDYLRGYMDRQRPYTLSDAAFTELMEECVRVRSRLVKEERRRRDRYEMNYDD